MSLPVFQCQARSVTSPGFLLLPKFLRRNLTAEERRRLLRGQEGPSLVTASRRRRRRGALRGTWLDLEPLNQPVNTSPGELTWQQANLIGKAGSRVSPTASLRLLLPNSFS